MSPRQYVDRADVIGVAFVPAFHAPEYRLRLAVFLTHAAALRAGSAGVVRWHGHQHPPIPGQFVFQLPSELVPALIKDAFGWTLAFTFFQLLLNLVLRLMARW